MILSLIYPPGAESLVTLLHSLSCSPLIFPLLLPPKLLELTKACVVAADCVCSIIAAAASM